MRRLSRLAAWLRKQVPPIPMILFCPACGRQHIDADDKGWANPPHRSHLCHSCGHIWRPSDYPTNGVAEIETSGKCDARPPLNAMPADLGEDEVPVIGQAVNNAIVDLREEGLIEFDYDAKRTNPDEVCRVIAQSVSGALRRHWGGGDDA